MTAACVILVGKDIGGVIQVDSGTKKEKKKKLDEATSLQRP